MMKLKTIVGCIVGVSAAFWLSSSAIAGCCSTGGTGSYPKGVLEIGDAKVAGAQATIVVAPVLSEHTPSSGIGKIVLFCQNNGGGSQVSSSDQFVGTATVPIGKALQIAAPNNKQGKLNFSLVANGVFATLSHEDCTNNPDCNALRELCDPNFPNGNAQNWDIKDIVPFDMVQHTIIYYSGGPGHLSPCNPDIKQFPVDPDEVHRCATNTGGTNPTTKSFSYDWANTTGGVLVPMAYKDELCSNGWEPNPSPAFGEIGPQYLCITTAQVPAP